MEKDKDGDMSNIPDIIFRTDNEFDIPMLDIERQARFAELPWARWGHGARSTNYRGGTLHFYTDDYKFSGLWKRPDMVVNTGVVSVVECNYSSTDGTPRVLFLEKLYRKRWMSCYWQSYGIDIIVDLYVARKFSEDVFLGVPEGWGAYCTRYDEELTVKEYERALFHAGRNKILFVVYGGGNRGREYCHSIGGIHIEDGTTIVRKMIRPSRAEREEMENG